MMLTNDIINRIPQMPPRIWIERLVVLKSLETYEIIRDIALTRGLNVIWGTELPESSTGDSPLILSGHSVGKTSLCRLIRYCLGEAHFGTSYQERAIRSTFSDGHVCALVHVGESSWTVSRPLGKRRKSKADDGALFADIISGKQQPAVDYTDFLADIEIATIGKLSSVSLPATESAYTWQDLLAWLARDQEARFRSQWEWRSPRSESADRKLKKDQALFLMRLVLGLIHEKERAERNELYSLSQQEENVASQIAGAKAEPLRKKYMCQRMLEDIVGQYSMQQEGAQASLLGIESLVQAKLSELAIQITSALSRLGDFDADILLREISIKHFRDTVDKLRVELEIISKSAANVNQDQSDKIAKLEVQKEGRCTYGTIPFSDCSYFGDYLVKLKQKQQDWEKNKARELRNESEEEQLEILCSLDENLKDSRAVYVKSVYVRDRLLEEKRAVEKGCQELTALAHILESTLKEWQLQNSICEGVAGNKELQVLLEKEKDLASRKAAVELRLKEYLADYDSNLAELTAVYDGLIKNVLAHSFSGTVDLPGGELRFGIKEDAGFHGEAVETLSIVIADVAAMVSSAANSGLHPGFLLHDSPREADLDRHIYDRYFLVIQQLAASLGGPDGAPFQYIVTTTSAPPEAVINEDLVRARFCGRPESGMLFGCSLRVAEAEQLSALPTYDRD